MKKHLLLILALTASFALQAQWVDDPRTNTFLANCSADAGEIYTATDPVSGDTYIQWTQGSSNGWSPTLQRVNFEGVPQWGSNGIHPGFHHCPSWSQGISMTATTDNAAVTCFANSINDGSEQQCIAIKINADGTYAWGEEGIVVFDRTDCSRTEVMAGNDGGVWALSTNITETWLRYIDADGVLHPEITISDPSTNCTFSLMVPGLDNSVLVVFEKETHAYTYYYEKELWVVGYTTDGVQIAPEVQLMAPYTMGGSYCHYVVPDGANGGYAFIWHAGIMNAFNTYVFHFDEYGNSTINDLNGTPVHTTDPSNYYTGAYGTADPISHDLIIAYEQTDSYSQAQSRIYVNRITSTGERLWDEGILVADYLNNNYSDILVDAFEDGSGFSIIYNNGDGYNSTVEAKGFDMDGNLLWSKQMCSNNYPRYMCDNSTGFHGGQNVVAWVNSSTGGVYGQNIGPDGTMGPIEPPVITCLAPENFEGEYTYDIQEELFGVNLSWVAPETQPLLYNLYRHGIVNKDDIVIEVPGDATSYFDESGLGEFKYQLTAVYENCESDYALTSDGEDFVYIIVTGIEEETDDDMVTIERIFTMNGQCLKHNNVDELSDGVYFLQGLTQNGNLITKKIVVRH